MAFLHRHFLTIVAISLSLWVVDLAPSRAASVLSGYWSRLVEMMPCMTTKSLDCDIPIAVPEAAASLGSHAEATDVPSSANHKPGAAVVPEAAGMAEDEVSPGRLIDVDATIDSSDRPFMTCSDDAFDCNGSVRARALLIPTD